METSNRDTPLQTASFCEAMAPPRQGLASEFPSTSVLSDCLGESMDSGWQGDTKSFETKKCGFN